MDCKSLESTRNHRVFFVLKHWFFLVVFWESYDMIEAAGIKLKGASSIQITTTAKRESRLVENIQNSFVFFGAIPFHACHLLLQP
jgi:hypothetical protein